jgi:hypothetical protein
MLIVQLPANSNNTANAIVSDAVFEEKLPYIPPVPETSIQDSLIQRALNVEGVKNWSVSGWEPSIDWYGVSEPTPHWTKAIVQLKLDNGKGSPKYACSEGWVSSIEFDLESNKITKEDYPTEQKRACYKGDIVLERPSQQIQSGDLEIQSMPSFIQTADAAHTFLLGTQQSVSTNNRYGAFAYISTPSIDNANIWTEMNQYVAHTINQDFATSPATFLQVGYLLTTVSGCSGCGITADDAHFAYVDEGYWGDLQPRKINITYTENSNAIAYIICDAGTKIKEQLWHNGNFFTRNSSVNCGTTNTTSTTDNSVFFENANTNTSSTWSDEVETSVKAWNAKEYTSTTSYQNWSDSINKKINCSGSITTTTLITGNLKAAGTATWSGLSSMDAAC